MGKGGNQPNGRLMFGIAKEKGHLINSLGRQNGCSRMIGYEDGRAGCREIASIVCDTVGRWLVFVSSIKKCQDGRRGRSEQKSLGGEPGMLAQAKTSRRRTAQLQRVLLKHQWWWSEGQMLGVDAHKKFWSSGWMGPGWTGGSYNIKPIYI